MKIRSFRMRIALLSVVCSTLALAGSAIAAWRIGWSIALGDIDSQSRSLIRHGLVFPVAPFGRGGFVRDFGGRGGGPRDGDPRGGDFFFRRDDGGGGRWDGGGPPRDGGRDGGPDRGGGPRGDGGPRGQIVTSMQIPWMPLQQDQPPGMAPKGSETDADEFKIPDIFLLRIDFGSRNSQKSDNWPAALSVDAYTTLALSLTSPKPPADPGKDGSDPRAGFFNAPFGQFNMFSQGPTAYAPSRTVRADGRDWRVATGASGDRAMVLGVDLTSYQKNSWRTASAFLWSIPFALAFIAIGAAFTASRALRPMNELIRLSEGINASGLDRRIASPTDDAEFRRLIDVFNGMMERLERSFRQANRFSADAAHELRTPLTILQGDLERMLQQTPPGSSGQQQIERLLEEIHRVKSIVEKLLLLARMDAGQVRLNLEPVDLSALCESVREDIQAIAPGIAVNARIEPGIAAAADAALLETAIQNLGSNAVKYNAESAGRIEIDLTRSGGRIRLSIANAGPRIAETDREKIFDRFFRSDPSRSREIDGAGLGLSLAREIVLAHHGWLVLDPTDRELNRFDIILPETVAAARD